VEEITRTPPLRAGHAEDAHAFSSRRGEWMANRRRHCGKHRDASESPFFRQAHSRAPPVRAPCRPVEILLRLTSDEQHILHPRALRQPACSREHAENERIRVGSRAAAMRIRGLRGNTPRRTRSVAGRAQQQQAREQRSSQARLAQGLAPSVLKHSVMNLGDCSAAEGPSVAAGALARRVRLA